MYENMTLRQRLQAYVALMYPVLVRRAAEGKLPGVLKPAEHAGGGRAAEPTADTSRQTA